MRETGGRTATSAPASAAIASSSLQTWQPWRTPRRRRPRRGPAPRTDSVADGTREREREKRGSGQEGRHETNMRSLIAKGTRRGTEDRERKLARQKEGGTNLRGSRGATDVLPTVKALRVHVLVEPSDSSAWRRGRTATRHGVRAGARILVRGHVVQRVAPSGPSRGRETTGNDGRRARDQLAVVLVLCAERGGRDERGQPAVHAKASSARARGAAA